MGEHAVYWLKRDFRLADNVALTHALREQDSVTPLFVLEPSFLMAAETSAFHVHAVHGALADLNRQLETAEKTLAIVEGEVVATLENYTPLTPFRPFIVTKKLA